MAAAGGLQRHLQTGRALGGLPLCLRSHGRQFVCFHIYNGSAFRNWQPHHPQLASWHPVAVPRTKAVPRRGILRVVTAHAQSASSHELQLYEQLQALTCILSQESEEPEALQLACEQLHLQLITSSAHMAQAPTHLSSLLADGTADEAEEGADGMAVPHTQQLMGRGAVVGSAASAVVATLQSAYSKAASATSQFANSTVTNTSPKPKGTSQRSAGGSAMGNGQGPAQPNNGAAGLDRGSSASPQPAATGSSEDESSDGGEDQVAALPPGESALRALQAQADRDRQDQQAGDAAPGSSGGAGQFRGGSARRSGSRGGDGSESEDDDGALGGEAYVERPPTASTSSSASPGPTLQWHPELRQAQFSIDADSEDEEEGVWASRVRAKRRSQRPPSQQSGQQAWSFVRKFGLGNSPAADLPPDKGPLLPGFLPGVQSASKLFSKMSAKVGGLGKVAASQVARVSEPLASRLLTREAAAAVVSSAQKAVQESATAATKVVQGAAAVAANAADNLPKPAVAAAQKAAAGAAEVAGRSVSAAAAVGQKIKLLVGSVAGGGLHSPSSTWLIADRHTGEPGLSSTTISSSSNSGQHSCVRFIAVAASKQVTEAVLGTQKQLNPAGLVSFESRRLGVQVSKAVYDEASQLYNTLLPLIADFEQEHPDGRICFTGSGAGGSLATMLALMALSRGCQQACLIPAAVVFDAPPVLAQVVAPSKEWGCDGAQQDACDDEDWAEMRRDTAARGLLAKLGLPPHAIVNVVTPDPQPLPVAEGRSPPPTSQPAGAPGAAKGSTPQALQAASKGSASPPTQGSSVPVNVVASADADNTSMPRAAEAGGTSSDIEAAPQTQGRGTAAGDNQRLLLTTIGKVHVLSKC